MIHILIQSILKLNIFWRTQWGNLIFESDKGNYANRMWEGTYKGELLPVATYYYIIYAEGDDSGETLNGIVTIINGKN